MQEDLHYIKLNDKLHFIHEHIPSHIQRRPIIFLNPFFDEKKRSQRFYAETSRELCKTGTPVIRFDYYGTGDSEGQLFDLELNKIILSTKKLIEYATNKYNSENVCLLGLRIGADMAMKATEELCETISDLILIEPVICGKSFISEQRYRKKIFHKLNNMHNLSTDVFINGEKFEDFLGYPLSRSNINYINNLNSLEVNLNDKNILLIKVNSILSKKNMILLNQKLKEKNRVQFFKFSYNRFWETLEPIDTIGLSEKIIQAATN